MPPPPIKPEAALSPKMAIIKMVMLNTKPERASDSNTLKIIVRGDAPMACAASTTPRGTSFRFCSTSRAK